MHQRLDGASVRQVGEIQFIDIILGLVAVDTDDVTA